jgi:hypothetical protein
MKLETDTRLQGDSMDAQLETYIENMEWQIGKMVEGTEHLTEAQMTWTPAGINNSISWLMGHFAGVLWECYGIASGVKVGANLSEAGIPAAWLENLTYDERAPLPGETSAERTADLEAAWTTLKDYLVEHHPAWEAVHVKRPPDQIKSMWWMLHHCLIDGGYHTGQASYLKMLLRVG